MPRTAELSLSPLESREVPAAGLFADIRPGVWGSNPTLHAASGDTLYFSANNIHQGTELWATDGTAAGTRLVKDLNPGKPGSNIFGHPAGGGVFYFIQSNERSRVQTDYKTDGTTAGTVPVAHGYSSINAAGGIVGTGWKGDLYFYSKTATAGVWALNKTDGHTVTQLTTFNGQPLDQGWSDVYPVFPAGPNLYDGGTDALQLTIRLKTGDTQVWRTDGTAAGTVIVQTHLKATSTATGDVKLLAGTPLAGGKFAFASEVGYRDTTSSLWAGDGTSTARTLLRQFDGLVSSPYGGLTSAAVNGRAVFKVHKANWQDPPTVDTGVWVTDGTDGGTVKVNVPADSNVAGTFDGRVVLGVPTADPNHWTTMLFDGNAVKAIRVPEGTAGLKWEFRGTIPGDAANPKGWMVFQESSSGKAYRTDGTAAGTTLVDTAGLPVSPYNSVPHFTWHDVNETVGFADWNTGGGVYFKGAVYLPGRTPGLAMWSEEYRRGTELWKWDLTPPPPAAPAPKVLSTQVNDGSAQRSMVKSISVKFDAAVAIDMAGVTITNASGQAIAFTGGITTTAVGETTLTLFPTGVGGSIADGRYTVKINAAAVKTTAGGTAMAADHTFGFTRLYGDTSGDGVYDRDTRMLVKALLGQTVGSPGYRSDLDVNSDGKIDAADELAAIRNWGKSV